MTFARRTIATFEQAGVDAVVVNSAGCGSAMKEYERLLGGADGGWAERAAEMSNTCASRGIASTATDMLICSVAYTAGAAIMSSDRDFMGYSKSLPIRLFTTVA